MKITFLFASIAAFAFSPVLQAGEPQKPAVGEAAPAFKIKDSSGQQIDLAALTAKGPVLVRLTCGCRASGLRRLWLVMAAHQFSQLARKSHTPDA